MSQDLSNELLDHVDDEDRVIGRIPRHLAHREGLWHRAVHVVVWNRQGRILLQLRAASKASFPGFWDTSVGGHVGAGETYMATSVRECSEELGIEIAETDLARIGKHLFDEMPTDMEWVESWALVHEGPFCPDPIEVERVAWFTADEVDAMVSDSRTTPHFALQWRRELSAMTRDRS